MRKATAGDLFPLVLLVALASAATTGQTRGDDLPVQARKPDAETAPAKGATKAKAGTPTGPYEQWIQAADAASRHANELRERLTKGMSYDEVNALLELEGRRRGSFSSPGGDSAAVYEWLFPDNTRVEGKFKGNSLVEWEVFEYVPPPPKPQLPAKVQEYVEASQRCYAEWAARMQRTGVTRYLDSGPLPLWFGESTYTSPNGERQTWDLRVGRIGYFRTAEIMQIIDDNSLLVGVKGKNHNSQVVMLKGYATAGHVDGEEVAFPILEVAGTVRYTTVAGGSKTIFTLKPFNIEPFRSVIPASMLDE